MFISQMSFFDGLHDDKFEALFKSTKTRNTMLCSTAHVLKGQDQHAVIVCQCPSSVEQFRSSDQTCQTETTNEILLSD